MNFIKRHVTISLVIGFAWTLVPAYAGTDENFISALMQVNEEITQTEPSAKHVTNEAETKQQNADTTCETFEKLTRAVLKANRNIPLAKYSGYIAVKALLNILVPNVFFRLFATTNAETKKVTVPKEAHYSTVSCLLLMNFLINIDLNDRYFKKNEILSTLNSLEYFTQNIDPKLKEKLLFIFNQKYLPNIMAKLNTEKFRLRGLAIFNFIGNIFCIMFFMFSIKDRSNGDIAKTLILLLSIVMLVIDIADLYTDPSFKEHRIFRRIQANLQ